MVQNERVRIAALRGMQTLYSSADNIPLLVGFTDRFRHRINELIMDVDPEVAVASLQLQATMFEQGLLKLDGLAHATRSVFFPFSFPLGISSCIRLPSLFQ